MIAKSDFVILLVSLSALGGGVYRWQHNISTVPAVTVPASLQSNVRTTVSNSPATASVTAQLESQTLDSTAPRIVNATEATNNIVVKTESVNAAIGNVPAAQENNTVSTRSDVRGGEPLYGIHKVEYGDYLGKIANRYGTTVRTLREANELSGSDIYVGQELRYPLPAN